MAEKTRMTMEPGVRYRGYASINEFGEISFTPEQKGSRPSNLSIVYRDEHITLYESKFLFKVSVQVPKSNDMLTAIVNRLTDAVTMSLRYIKRQK